MAKIIQTIKEVIRKLNEALSGHHVPWWVNA